jgi:NAD(P)-dependent dehydrogenase (short-subunit alcohol dehydrogenase family)
MPRWTTNDIPLQAGKLAVVTGANSGIGWHTALELARAGAEVILAARTEAKGRDAVEQIRQQLPRAKVRYDLLDLASLDSVQAFASKVGQDSRLDLLVHNAGVMAVPTRQLTRDGFELQLGTNFLGPFALTGLLMPVLQRAPSPRVTTVSSGAANMGLRRINFEDLQWEHSYGPWKAYCQSKLADLMFALELARRCAAASVPLLSNAAHPGFARTNLQTSGRGKPENALQRLGTLILSQDAANGALPTLRAATAADAVPASYYGPSGIFQLKGDAVPITIPKPAQDEAAARRLWEVSQQLTGVHWGTTNRAASNGILTR